MHPTWDQMHESDGTKRLKLLMPTVQGAFFDKSAESEETECIEFPVLQPIWMSGDLHRLESWDSSPAAIVIEVQFSDLLNVLPGSEYSVGQVAIPFADIVKSGKVSGWYDVSASSGGEDEESAIAPPHPFLDLADDSEKSANDGRSQVFVKASWVPPEDSSSLAVETVRESSHAIQEEMVRSALLSRQHAEKLGILGSSLGALNTVRGISANLLLVQNTLGSILDTCESCTHAFDFTVRRLPLDDCVHALSLLPFLVGDEFSLDCCLL